MVAKRYVIGNEQNWSIEVIQIVCSKNTHPAHNECDWQNDRVEEKNTNPRDRKSRRPVRVRIRPRIFINLTAHNTLEISNGCCLCKSRFVNIDLILVFQRTKQLDS